MPKKKSLTEFQAPPQEETVIPRAPLSESARGGLDTEGLAPFLDLVDLRASWSPVLVQRGDFCPKRVRRAGDRYFVVVRESTICSSEEVQEADEDTMRIMRARFLVARDRYMAGDAEAITDPERRFLIGLYYLRGYWSGANERQLTGWSLERLAEKDMLLNAAAWPW